MNFSPASIERESELAFQVVERYSARVLAGYIELVAQAVPVEFMGQVILETAPGEPVHLWGTKAALAQFLEEPLLSLFHQPCLDASCVRIAVATADFAGVMEWDPAKELAARNMGPEATS